MSSNLYYALCFDKTEDVDSEPSNFYHCIAAAQNEDDFKATVLKHRNVELTRTSTVTDYLKESGYKKEILDLSQKIDDYTSIAFSDPITFFTGATSNEEGKLLEDEAHPNGVVTLNVEYQERDNFMKHAKAWLLREAGYECQDPRFPNIYTIIDPVEAERSILLVDAPQFNAHLLLAHFGDKMHSLFEGNQALEMETAAPYLLGSTNIVDFITSLHDEPHSVWNEDKGIEYTSEKQYKGVMLIKTNKSLDEVRRRLRRFTRIKTPEDKWVYFRFAEQLTTQEWLKHSEPEAVSYFMEFIDEILFARCDTCSFHKVTANKEKLISNPKYPNLNGGFLYTKRQQNTHLLGRKKNIIGEAEAFLYKHYADLLKARKRTRDHVQSYLLRMWDNFHKAGGETNRGYTQSAMAGLYLGVDYMFDPCKLQFIHGEMSLSYDEDIDLDQQTTALKQLKAIPFDFFFRNKEENDKLLQNFIHQIDIKNLSPHSYYDLYIQHFPHKKSYLDIERFDALVSCLNFNSKAKAEDKIVHIFYSLEYGLNYQENSLLGEGFNEYLP